jgi:hypothetical protein
MKSALNLSIGLFCLVTLFGGPAHAAVCHNAYVSFSLPDKWQCNLEQTEWVCRTVDSVTNREAIIILTAKEIGPSDSLPGYLQHLKTARTIPSRTGQPLQSQVLKVEQRNISGQPWVDGMQLSSEIPNYYTRYLATTKDRIGVLVTFSAHKLFYTKYSADFFRTIESLRIIATKSLMSGGGGANVPGSETLGMNTGANMMPTDMNGDAPGEGSGGGGNDDMVKGFLALALVLGAGGVYFFIKKQKKESD